MGETFSVSRNINLVPSEEEYDRLLTLPNITATIVNEYRFKIKCMIRKCSLLFFGYKFLDSIIAY